MARGQMLQGKLRLSRCFHNLEQGQSINFAIDNGHGIYREPSNESNNMAHGDTGEHTSPARRKFLTGLIEGAACTSLGLSTDKLLAHSLLGDAISVLSQAALISSPSSWKGCGNCQIRTEPSMLPVTNCLPFSNISALVIAPA
jgi:hypothetical protein